MGDRVGGLVFRTTGLAGDDQALGDDTCRSDAGAGYGAVVAARAEREGNRQARAGAGRQGPRWPPATGARHRGGRNQIACRFRPSIVPDATAAQLRAGFEGVALDGFLDGVEVWAIGAVGLAALVVRPAVEDETLVTSAARSADGDEHAAPAIVKRTGSGMSIARTPVGGAVQSRSRASLRRWRGDDVTAGGELAAGDAQVAADCDSSGIARLHLGIDGPAGSSEV